MSSGRPGRQLARLDADHLAILGDAGAQIGLGETGLRPRGGEAGLRLRHVGTGHLADIEAVVGLAQLLVDDFDVVALQIEDRRVAQHVHVGCGGIEQGVLLVVRQRLTGAENCGLSACSTEFVVRKPLKRFWSIWRPTTARDRGAR